MVEFYSKIHNSLAQPIMLAGVPREICILNGTIGAALVLGLHSPLGLPLSVLIHVIAMNLAKKDPQFFDVIKRSLKQKKYYDV